jgi:hypothetical protein
MLNSVQVLNPVDSTREFQAMLEKMSYDIWMTVTFGIRVDEYNAIRTVKHFFKGLNKPHGIFYYNSYMHCWLFAEQKPWQDRVHIHSLIRGIDPRLSSDLQSECQERFGKVHAVPYNPSLSYRATQYIAEKFACGWLKSYDFCKINSRWRWNKKVYSSVADNGNPATIQANLSER